MCLESFGAFFPFFFFFTNFYYKYTTCTGTITAAAATETATVVTGAAAAGQWEELETQHVSSQNKVCCEWEWIEGRVRDCSVLSSIGYVSYMKYFIVVSLLSAMYAW